MSYSTFEVITVEFDSKYVEVATDEHGGTSTERQTRHTLRAKCIDDAQARSGATQLYALAGVCFVPLLVDALWYFSKFPEIFVWAPYMPRIKMISTPREEEGGDEVLEKKRQEALQKEKEEKARRKKELCWKYGIIGGISFNPLYEYNECTEEPERIHGACCIATSFVFSIIGVGFGVAYAAGALVGVLFFSLLSPILWITGCLSVFLYNVLYAATCSPKFKSYAVPFALTKTLADDGSHWELNGDFCGTTGGACNNTTSPFPESMKAGDKFQVAFGPIESACLFQRKAKVVEAETSDVPL